MRTIFITGGAGYLGTNITLAELKKGNNVIVLDDFQNAHRCHIERIKHDYPDRLTIYTGRVQDTQILDNIFSSHSIDYVIHLAAYKYVGESIHSPDMYMSNNMDSLRIILDYCNRYNTEKFAFSSSAVVYGNAELCPSDEDCQTSPLSPYAKTKSLGEEEVLKWAQLNQKSAIIFRFSNPIGAEPTYMLGDDSKKGFSNLLPYIINSAKNHSQMVFKGNNHDTPDGTAIRDYIYVCDLAHTVTEVLERFNEKKAEILNVSRGEGFSVLQILQAVKDNLKLDIDYTFTSKNPEEASISLLSPQKLHNTYSLHLDTPLSKIVDSEVKYREFLSNTLKSD